jgi:hypothetical protein
MLLHTRTESFIFMVRFESASQLLNQLMDAMGLNLSLFLCRNFSFGVKKLKKRQKLVHFWGQNTQKRLLFSTF